MTTNDTGYYPDSGDVKVVKFKPTICDDCSARATHDVQLDLRAIGMTIGVGRYCQTCANGIADRLRESLYRTTGAA